MLCPAPRAREPWLPQNLLARSRRRLLSNTANPVPRLCTTALPQRASCCVSSGVLPAAGRDEMSSTKYQRMHRECAVLPQNSIWGTLMRHLFCPHIYSTKSCYRCTAHVPTLPQLATLEGTNLRASYVGAPTGLFMLLLPNVACCGQPACAGSSWVASIDPGCQSGLEL